MPRLRFVLVVAALLVIDATQPAARQRANGVAQSEAARLAQQAIELFEAGRYKEATELAALGVAAVDRLKGRETSQDGVALNNLAHLYRRVDDLARAEGLMLRALAVYERTLPPVHDEVANTLNNLASVYESQAKHPEAERLYLRSLAITEMTRGADSVDAATTLGNIGGLRSLLGDYAGAEDYLKRAYDIDRRKLPPDHIDIARDLNNLGSLYMYKGEPARAEPFLAEALQIVEKTLRPDHPRTAAALHSLGTVRHLKGDHSGAESNLLRALNIREAAFGSRHADVVSTLNNLGLVYQAAEEFARANEIYTRAIPLAEEVLGPGHPTTGTMLNNMTVVLTSLGSHDRAEEMGLRSLAIHEKFNPDHPDVAVALNNLALLYQRRGAYARAKTSYERALAIDEKVLGSNHPTVALLLSNFATLQALNGNVADAVRLMTKNSAIHENNLQVMMSAGSENEKRRYLDTLLIDTFTTISLHAVEAPDDQSAARLALTTVLQRKGRVLDTMAEQIAGLRRRLSPQDQTLLDQLSTSRTKIARQILWPDTARASTSDGASVAKLLAEAERLEQQISERSTELRIMSRTVSLGQVQDLIPVDAALVEIALFRPLDLRATTQARGLGAPRYIAYTLTHDGVVSCADLGEAAVIDPVVLALRENLSDPTRTGMHSPARRLDEWIMGPIRKALKGKRTLLLSPDGALNLVPFAALVDENDKYLVEDYTITYLTSGRDLLRLSDDVVRRGPPVVVANPSFDRADATARVAGGAPASSRRSSDLANTRWAPLEGTADEARELRRFLPKAQVLTEGLATETALKQVSGPRILHIATHGFFLPDDSDSMAPIDRHIAPAGFLQARASGAEQPLLRSGLILAGANVEHTGSGDDGILTALEVSGMDLRGTQLVVLSACETGLGDVRNGEGVFGLRRALVLAGAASQMVTLWKVDDLATRDLVVEYYRRLQEGEGRSEALRGVQLAMLGKSEHPYYWASFLSVGDWRPFTVGGDGLP